MGIIKRGILGGFSGTVANVVGSSWKGIAVIKSKPLSVANPRTNLQVTQRNAFGSCVAVASEILVTVIKPLWDRFSVAKSGYNSFVAANIKCFGVSGFESPEDLIIASGKIATTEITSIVATNNNPLVRFNFNQYVTGALQSVQDVPYAVVFNFTQNTWSVSYALDIRNQGFCTVTCATAVVTDDLLHCYLAFKREDGTVVSNTSYQQYIVL